MMFMIIITRLVDFLDQKTAVIFTGICQFFLKQMFHYGGIKKQIIILL